MYFFHKKNKSVLDLARFLAVGLFFFGGFFLGEKVAAEPMSCQCEEAAPGCATVDLPTAYYNSDNRDNFARTACDVEAECTATSVFAGVCPGWNVYACDNCFQADGGCALLYAHSEINAREKCWRQVPGCASFGQANVTVAPGTCSVKTFVYQGSVNGAPCACQEVDATDLAGAQEIVNNFAPNVTDCDSSNSPTVEGIGQCPPPASGGKDFHCFRIDDNVCMPIKAQDYTAAQDQAINFCQASAASSPAQPRAELGPCPSAPSAGVSIPSGKSAQDLLAEASGSLNPARINQPTDLIGKAIRLLMAFIGSISLVLYVYAGILWLSASGASERVDQAKKVIVWTTLGLVVMLGSYMLVNFAFKSLQLIK